MYPDGSAQRNQTEGTTKDRGGNAPDGPMHRQVQTIHDRYFMDLMQAWNASMQEVQAIQNEFSRSVERAMQSQDFMGVQNAQFELQRTAQEVAAAPDARNRFMDAFRGYKEGIVKALANANIDDLSYTDLALLSQSMAVVAQNAFMLAMTTCDPTQLAKSAGMRTNQEAKS